MPPRPILKALPSAKPHDYLPEPASSNPLPFAACSGSGSAAFLFSPHVHFPTHPCTLTGAAYSPGSYDRAPIAVSPGSRALRMPRRGGRLYPRPGAAAPMGSYFHPRAFEACGAPEPEPEPEESESESVPELVAASETDRDTDECVSPSPPPGPPVAVAVAGRIPAALHRDRRAAAVAQGDLDSDQTQAFSSLPHRPEKRRKKRKSRGPVPMARSSFSTDVESDSCLDGF